MFDPNNYLNSIWSICYEIIKNQFPNYTVETEKLEIERVIDRPTILILHPRSNIITYGNSYNSENRKEFKLTIFCFDVEDGGASKLTGEIQMFVNKNQHLFSKEGLRRVHIDDPEYIDDVSDLHGYTMEIKGFVIL